MKTKDIALKYHIDVKDFEDFLCIKNKKRSSGFSGMVVDDALVDSYVSEYCIERNINKCTYANSKESTNHNPGLRYPTNGAVYSIDGVRGRHIDIFDNKCIITTKVTIGSLITHNVTDGQKTIYYTDVVGVQFKPVGKLLIGYLQLETPGLTMNNIVSNFFNENTFTFDSTKVSNEKMEEVSNYIKSRIEEIKHPQKSNLASASTNNQISVADELLKFKQLLDMGALTQEEFDAKKKELLNL